MTPFEEYAVMVLCAGDVDQIWYELGNNSAGNPMLPAPADGTIAYVNSQNWELLGQLRCDDIYILKESNVYYGLLLRAKAAVGPVSAGDYLIAIRGTADPQEWINNLTAEVPDYQPGLMGGVGAGFWQVYATMTFGDLTDSNQKLSAAGAMAAIIRANPKPVFVTGHSLGAALATYLVQDLHLHLNGVPLIPYFFASPKVGTQDYVDNYKQAVINYTLVNFAGDVVPMLPSSPPFVDLSGGGPFHNVHIIPRNSQNAPPFPQLDLALNHSPVTYASMLDPANVAAKRLLA